jgi:nifR3 family TIM-barrel protein
MKDEELTEELVEAIVKAVKIPVTVKMRLGWDENNINAPNIAKNLEQIGVAAVAVHGRTAAQGYTGNVNLEGIKAVVQAVKNIPVIGNGDVSTHHDAKKMLEQVGVSAVMVGRAALKDPFFFSKTAKFLETGIEPVETTLEERIQFMHRHFAVSVHFMGEENACIYFRTVIPNYCEYFPNKKDWVKVYHELGSVSEYIEAMKLVVPKECSAEAKNPDLKELLDLPLRENELDLVY